MPSPMRGAGVIFFDRRARRVLLVRRDNIPTIPFPDHLNILGGHTEAGETPEETAVREMAEELEDLRTGRPFVLEGHRPFTIFTDARGVTDHVFAAEANFDLTEVRLKEGQELVWMTEEDVRARPLAFGYEPILAEFFQSLRMGAV